MTADRIKELEDKLATARQEERERCAKVCHGRMITWQRTPSSIAGHYMVEAECCEKAVRALTDEVAK